MGELISINDVNVFNKKVLIRADLNVPIKDDIIMDYSRIERFIPTIEYLCNRGAKVIVLSHFGRPGGEYNSRFSIKKIFHVFKKKFRNNVHFIDKYIENSHDKFINNLKVGSIVILENIRFYKGEEANDLGLAMQLSKLGDIFVNDAFSVSHRSHASTVAITKFLPSYIGPLLQQELNTLSEGFDNASHPIMAIIGGSKISTKIELLNNIMNKVDILVIGGGIANTFLYAKGINIGKSFFEPNKVVVANKILKESVNKKCEIILPLDCIVSKSINEVFYKSINNISDELIIMDIGDQTINYVCKKMQQCKTVIWNGPVGVFEVSPFNKGTLSLAEEISNLTKSEKLYSIAGGGETLAALNLLKTAPSFSYLSTGGGAFLRYLEGSQLPGIISLMQ